MSYFSNTADFSWNQDCIVDLGAGKFPMWMVGGGLTPENMLFMVQFDKKIVFLTVAGFGIFGPHKILGEGGHQMQREPGHHQGPTKGTHQRKGRRGRGKRSQYRR